METKEEKIYYRQEPELGQGSKRRFRQHFNRGLTFFLVISACILFYFLLFRLESVSNVVNMIIEILQPIVFGMAIAYMLNPIVKNIDKRLIPLLEKKMETTQAEKTSRTIGVAVALIFLILLIYALCAMLIPELYNSIRNLIMTLPNQIEQAVIAINEFEVKGLEDNSIVVTVMEQFNDSILKWFQNDMMGQIENVMTGLTSGVFNVVSVLWNMILGLIVSVYVLFSKDTFSAQAKKLTYAFCSTYNANLILHLTSKANEIFSGFIIGKIIDSAIIGVICFCGLTILDMPYILLVSVIVGVTNVIPFFGPFIGAIPSAILIILDNPMKGVYFIIFVLLLQQLDGNVIGPKILGNSTGLSSFWVIFSILLFGGIFGVFGMIIGVPTVALIFYAVDLVTRERLKQKNLPTASSAYGQKSYVDKDGSYVNMETEEKAEVDK